MCSNVDSCLFDAENDADGDNDGGADCLDPEALAVQAGGDLSVNIPNCYVVRFCDLDPSNDCPL